MNIPEPDDQHHVKLVRYIEGLAANAWPAERVEHMDGWRLRFAQGVTQRANSVWPNIHGGQLPLEIRLAVVERFYAHYGLPARYQLCPAAQPADLDAILAERGYRANERTTVQTVDIANVLRCIEDNPTVAVTVADHFAAHWFTTYSEAESMSTIQREVRCGIVGRIAQPTGFALGFVGGHAVAVGLGVIEDGWVGVFCMATRQQFRRQGAAMAVLCALAQWGWHQGATQMYLQVMPQNESGWMLYHRVGFETLYDYHYRELATAHV